MSNYIYKVLIIDDNSKVVEIIKDYFQKENFAIISASTGKAGIKKTNNENPDIVILDINLPGIDGWKVCKKIRENSELPIIILSKKNEDKDKIKGIKLGADDYVTKPFNPEELIVRTKSILQRVKKDYDKLKNDQIKKFPHLVINNKEKKVKIDGSLINLTPKEFNLLWTLSSNPKKVFSRDNLVKKVWGYDYFGDIRTVDTHIKSLRKKLGKEVGSYIKTVWGVGYKFEV
ncbi:MAG: response regulator transcription factor [Bacillota bacterium]